MANCKVFLKYLIPILLTSLLKKLTQETIFFLKPQDLTVLFINPLKSYLGREQIQFLLEEISISQSKVQAPYLVE